jgi:biopolymer transport protein ExbB
MKKYVKGVLVLLLILGVAHGAPSFEESMKTAAAEYRQRAVHAAEALNRTRARIADEKAPLLQQMRAAEDRLVAAESENTRFETQRENSTELRQKLLLELDAIRSTTTYVGTLAHDGLKAATDALAPGEDQWVADQVKALQKQLDDASAAGTSGRTAMDIADFLLARTEQALGGYRADGKAMIADTSQVLKGTFAFVGPDTYFLPAEGGPVGTVRPREGARYPISYALANWKAQDTAAFFSGRPGLIMADASGGKALRLDETRGTFWQHVQKGGAVAMAIVLVGALAAAMILQKVRDLARMGVDSPATVSAFLNTVASGNTAEAEMAVKTLKRTTRELFSVGLQSADQPKTILEERLQAVLLEQRLHYERRLPLLAVIAVASPLMGLFGTVVGMVKTFALITVFGTGNAGKLSSGISQVLVATELGLAVAIPTLIAHGFLAQRIHKNLSLLERYALQFTTAVGAAQVVARNRRDKSVPV